LHLHYRSWKQRELRVPISRCHDVIVFNVITKNYWHKVQFSASISIMKRSSASSAERAWNKLFQVVLDLPKNSIARPLDIIQTHPRLRNVISRKTFAILSHRSGSLTIRVTILVNERSKFERDRALAARSNESSELVVGSSRETIVALTLFFGDIVRTLRSFPVSHRDQRSEMHPRARAMRCGAVRCAEVR